MLKRTPLKKRGVKADAWKLFRDTKAEKDRDYEGLIKCQCSQLGFRSCGVSLPSLDLHHIIGRDARPDLYYEESNLVWLVRSCHQKVHNQ